ncbi:hypothetical protein MYSTI_07887 [Myxococcus stipitatus DSM 14675]|uniref:Lipoprotein n=1 Tax=Myxococcus stipitatus (strain DSM 14675 / JCM 12634 / Mx s8) TaxID=1278073 RepID=L7URC5_MYXSD|nr:hypothetical protein [Myxococcus stipitatus]AGC49159.1 hypothetical protein MYSTI_07887 [Myxococcus stipitatus DSM 14675]
MSSTTKLRGWLLGGVLLLSTAAASASKSSVSLGDIELRVFDQTKAALVKREEAEDPYGMFVDAVFLVQVKGEFDGDKPLKLKVVVSAPKEESEAGERRAWKVTQTRELHALPESGVLQVPFLMPYECASTVKVVATLTGPGIQARKKLDTAFPCAE